jgi:pilus assembly protein CpaC
VLEDGVISLVVAPEVSSIDAAASININGLSIPGLQTRRAQTTVELRDGESFAMAGLLRKDFQNTIRQFPLLGSLPIIGALFRSAGFQKEETELVIIVTPRLVRPVPANRMRLPSESVQPANELELFLNGQNARNVAPAPLGGSAASSPSRGPARSAGGIEGAYGHIVR